MDSLETPVNMGAGAILELAKMIHKQIKSDVSHIRPIIKNVCA